MDYKMERIEEAVKRVNTQAATTTKRIVSDGVVDSVDLVGIVAELEEEFGVEIPMDEISPENFDSLPAMQSMLERLK